MKKHQRRGFTMIEIIIVLAVISTALISIISGVTNTVRYISEMRQRTIALNLAKEGIEAVYNIRNTNWRKRSANRDACWLKVNPMVDEGNEGCGDDRSFGILNRYSIDQNIHGGSFYLTPVGRDTSTIDGLDYASQFVKDNNKFKLQIKILDSINDPADSHWKYAIHFVDGEAISHTTFQNMIQEEPNIANKEQKGLGKYWRFITVGGLYNKESPIQMNCTNGLGNCGDDSAKELRFCSTVIYTSPYQGIINICSIMTNYLE